MSWIHRYTVQIGKLCLITTFVLGAIAPADASPGSGLPSQPSFWFAGRRIPIARAIAQSNDYAVPITDPALKELLNSLGATVTWSSGERYVLITTARPTVVSFAVGDTRYDVGPLTAVAAFAPFMRNGRPYVPFYELLRALSLEPKRDGETIVLQPQLSKIDVQSIDGRSTLTAQGAVPLKWRKLSDSHGKIVFEFDGVGSTLERLRSVNAAGLRTIEIEVIGTVRDPKTIMTLLMTDSASHGEAQAGDQGFSIGFLGRPAPEPLAVVNVPAAAATSAPEPLDAPNGSLAQSPAPAQLSPVTAIDALPSANGLNVTIAMSGNATYDWHRLGEPDNRFWVDIHGAQLQTVPNEHPQTDLVSSMRVRQMTPDTVRIALTLSGPKQVSVTPS
ncbi:MAG: AMIN domain-containing protein, partial [Candidatus Baltobacteraceae bacterium]